MKTNPHVAEIRELNLGYLLLAQRLLHHDRAEAMFRLKIDDEMADLLTSLSAQQLSRLASTNQLLCHFGGESAEQLRQVVDNPRDQGLSHIHSSLLMASRSMLSEGGGHVD
ncbi:MULTISPECIES: flagellar transcriptional regulator FlhD [Halomonas]|uniref:Flagellar transcriptional regulator FlhD n=1 Tax=Halomonas halophila TaxID=29573 RepID=A0ABQ0U6J1_9GAMM|nr:MULTISPECIES: flagellar transcriptional regulator FlhD [Halomonas]MDR5889024.1 flagellar transcriptional regulator FlhD [Halomonas salina]WJY07414.1 flagellar transcriptional regulator FlhD [Halomonas halophila]GEK74055.1 flagellar transcriptional regulator FlhD [Halomonas halophila]